MTTYARVQKLLRRPLPPSGNSPRQKLNARNFLSHIAVLFCRKRHLLGPKKEGGKGMATYTARHISFSYVIHNKNRLVDALRRSDGHFVKKWRDFFCISYSGRVKYRSRKEFFWEEKEEDSFTVGWEGKPFYPEYYGRASCFGKSFFLKRNTFSGLFGRNEGRRRRRRRRRRRLIASRCLMTYGSQKSDLCGILQRRRDSFLKSALNRAIIHCLKMP